MKLYPCLALLAAFYMGVPPLHAAELNTHSTLEDLQPSAASVPQTSFDPVIEDLPLMEGLVPVPGEATVFIAPPAGRIAESTVAGIVDIDGVYRYYHRSLPQLGWQIVDARTYRRNGEKLRIDAHADGKVTKVQFSIRPE